MTEIRQKEGFDYKKRPIHRIMEVFGSLTLGFGLT